MRDRKGQRRILKRSKSQENDTAKSLGGDRVIGSGNIPNEYMKEDAVSELWLVQCKFTDKQSYSLKKKEYLATKKHAQKMVKNPLWRIDIEGEDIALLDWSTFLKLIEDAGW